MEEILLHVYTILIKSMRIQNIESEMQQETER